MASKVIIIHRYFIKRGNSQVKVFAIFSAILNMYPVFAHYFIVDFNYLSFHPDRFAGKIVCRHNLAIESPFSAGATEIPSFLAKAGFTGFIARCISAFGAIGYC